MSNQKFKLWFILLVLGIAAVLVYRLLTVESRIPEHLQGVSQTNPESTQSLTENGQTGEIEHQAELPQFTPSEMDSILETLQPHRFHEDAYVEAIMLFSLKSNCKYSKTKKLPCIEITSRVNKLEKFIKTYQDFQHLPTSTELGEALKQGWAYDPQQPAFYRQNTQNLLKMLIKSDNPYVLSHYSTNFIYGGVDKGEVLPFAQWLNSQDQDYNGVVLMHALLKMAYQLELNQGIESGGFSSHIFCTIDESMCEMSYAKAYNLVVMPGMQKDVDLLVKHLRAFANEN